MIVNLHFPRFATTVGDAAVIVVSVNTVVDNVGLLTSPPLGSTATVVIKKTTVEQFTLDATGLVRLATPVLVVTFEPLIVILCLTS